MKLADKIQGRKVAYLLKREVGLAFELALLYYIQAKRKTADDKIIDSCQKSIYWLRKAEIIISENIQSFRPLVQLEELEQILVSNKPMICCEADALVRAVPIFNWDFVLRSSS
jgi:hypothetical protein